MIIDANTHPTPHGKWFQTALDASAETLVADMKQCGVNAALVVPICNTLSTQEAKQAASEFPSRLVAAYTFNPADYTSPEKAIAEFNSTIAKYPFGMIKFHNRLGKYHPNDERFLAVLKANDQLQKPHVVGVCGLLNDRSVEHAIDPAIYFFGLAQQIKNTKLIIMHGGGSDLMRIVETCRDLHHVFFDLSMTISRYRGSSVEADIKWLCQRFDRRLIWGSDFPETLPSVALRDMLEVAGDIALEKMNNILGNNILSLLGEEAFSKIQNTKEEKA